MKWLRTIVLFNQGDVISSSDWKDLHASYVRAIESVENPLGSGSLTLRRKQKRPDGEWDRNGVVPLRTQFLSYMLGEEGWEAESIVPLARDRDQAPLLLYPSMEQYCEPITSDFGGFDFTAIAKHGTKVAIEWETGNISSSHRSMNKLAIALGSGVIEVGVLIVPSRDLYEHLTDRIGNISELSGYLAAWAKTKSGVERGLLAITVVEHDYLTDSPDFLYLDRGPDGRSKAKRKKTKPKKARRTKAKRK